MYNEQHIGIPSWVKYKHLADVHVNLLDILSLHRGLCVLKNVLNHTLNVLTGFYDNNGKVVHMYQD